ncbi:Beta-lactamase class C and other penicillin binding protein [Arcticibacter svalbardensis MN12-7]|uniref:Beta-lactamase class C and other penicillin binding protein n=1 Tax=Arcticibacter svalbardensis MN12-7 TaxID=1150600 RepID=R9GM83_9SPHI|nr:hydrolase [Arcticibacter svalbardensis]EOR92801.1 Beta-lactamase class C and other penicillin binding protein [Arcticibacter svalbardensis MN12-7]
MILKYSYFLAIFLVCAQVSPAQERADRKVNYYTPTDQHDQTASILSTIPAIDSIYQVYQDKYHLPGVAYGIIYNGKLIYSGNRGYSNLDKKYAVSGQSEFRIASMTKSFVSTAILQLRDAGKIRLDDPAYLYIPELKNQHYLTTDAPVITIRNLLTHSAGFPEDNPWGDRQLDISDEELLTMIKKGISFSNVPGISYEYSNMGFALLGNIIKKVSGLTYEEYINKNILQPLGMNQTYWEYTKVPEKQLAHGYRWINEKWVEQPLLHDGAYGAMGGMITSMEDFSKYVLFHLSAWPASDRKETGPLKRSSVREMQQPWVFNNLNAEFTYERGNRVSPMTSAYGYGLRWSKDADGRTTVGHSGGLPGFGSNWMIMPDYGLAIITFSNHTYAPCTVINNNVLDALIQLGKLEPLKHATSSILQQRVSELLKLLPEWKDAERSGLFAENFFLDYYTDALKQESLALFQNMGKIKGIKSIIPENNLRGAFVLEAEKGNILLKITLTPENPALIQHYEMQEIK